MIELRGRFLSAAAACLLVSTTLAATSEKSSRRAEQKAEQKEDPRGEKTATPKDPESNRPQVRLKAQPVIAMSPARVVLTAELVGGANDYEEYYCPTVEWDWGDGTESSQTADCAPYEAGKTEIKRRFTVEHVFRAGAYRVSFRLKRHDKALAVATVSIQVRPGLRDLVQ